MVPKLPQPNPSAKSALAITNVILESVPWFGPAIKMHLLDRIENAQSLLLQKIARSGLQAFDDLTEEQRQFFVPSAYRFFEQVRLGERTHNMRVLARLLAGEMSSGKTYDVGCVARAARRLDMMTELSLACLARCERAMEIHAKRSPKHPLRVLTPNDLYLSTKEKSLLIDAAMALEIVDDYVQRGILAKASGFWEDTANDGLHRATKSYDEIVEAVQDVG